MSPFFSKRAGREHWIRAYSFAARSGRRQFVMLSMFGQLRPCAYARVSVVHIASDMGRRCICSDRAQR
jgi:hypothetical protein